MCCPRALEKILHDARERRPPFEQRAREHRVGRDAERTRVAVVADAKRIELSEGRLRRRRISVLREAIAAALVVSVRMGFEPAPLSVQQPSSRLS